MENTDTSPIFDSAAIRIHKSKDLTNATSREIALICRLTFKGIKDLLTGNLREIPYKSVLAAEVALNKIDDEYSKLKINKTGLEVQIWTEIKAIEDEFDGAISHISSAAEIQNRADPKYISYVRKGRICVEAINAKITGFDDIV